MGIQGRRYAIIRDVQRYEAKGERNGVDRISDKGFTLIELMITLAIMMTLGAIAISTYSGFIKKTKIVTAINEIRTIAREIDLYREDNGALPLSLDDIGKGSLRDPWGNPYQYVNFDTEPKGKWRRDRNMNPINTYYDLWSNGPDGEFQKQVSTPKSLDDIIRARDGNFIDVAAKF
ncbi:MAG: prepilin-type N-terminal cleavage/methylation domain-containing protein [Proteobacteria bacterium]|nr:prepilin-type N-terminal cleavage/methylation domain-containing protein [Pseudomonadota bacterium]